MTKNFKFSDLKKDDLEGFNNECEECKKEDKSVKENLILTNFKICNSCKISKTLFPI
jgi:hypothetical protein